MLFYIIFISNLCFPQSTNKYFKEEPINGCKELPVNSLSDISDHETSLGKWRSRRSFKLVKDGNRSVRKPVSHTLRNGITINPIALWNPNVSRHFQISDFQEMENN